MLQEMPTSLAGSGKGRDKLTDNSTRVSHENLSDTIISTFNVLLLMMGDRNNGLPMSNGYLDESPDPPGISTS